MTVLLGWIGHTDGGGSCGTTMAYRIWQDGERLSFNARFNALEAQLQTHVELSRVISTLVSCMR